MHSGYTYFHQYMCSLGIEPTTFALLTQCSNHWATYLRSEILLCGGDTEDNHAFDLQIVTWNKTLSNQKASWQGWKHSKHRLYPKSPPISSNSAQIVHILVCTNSSARVPWPAMAPRTGAALEASCPVSVSLEASRAPTPPPRWMVHGARCTVRDE